MRRIKPESRAESCKFVDHLAAKHQVSNVMLASGNRDSEVRYLADLVGITEIHAGQGPEEKVAIVKEAARQEKTLFVGDGINDAPAPEAAMVGVALGAHSDITSEAAGAVILTPSLEKVDGLMHIGRRVRSIALQSAVGGMALSVEGMVLAA